MKNLNFFIFLKTCQFLKRFGRCICIYSVHSSLLIRKRFHCMAHGDTICNWHVDTLHGGDTISNCKRLLSHHHRSSLSPLFSITVHHSSILLPHPIVFFLFIYIYHDSMFQLLLHSLYIQFSSLKNHTFQMAKIPVTVLIAGAAVIYTIPFLFYDFIFNIYCFVLEAQKMWEMTQYDFQIMKYLFIMNLILYMIKKANPPLS